MRFFRDRTKDYFEHSHTLQAIEARIGEGPRHSYLKDFIYGAVDGAVTTFAVVAGVAGAGLTTGIVIILGAANLVADGFSMAVSNFLGTRAEKQFLERARQMEEQHIDKIPQGESEEVRQIFLKKGFKGKDLERVVEVITSDKKVWVDTMLREELGLHLETGSPWQAAMTTFIAFILIGFIPLSVYVFQLFSPGVIGIPFYVSSLLTGLAFFVVGAFKSRFVGQYWIWGGLETLGIGGAAAMIAFFIGKFLKSLVTTI